MRDDINYVEISSTYTQHFNFLNEMKQCSINILVFCTTRCEYIYPQCEDELLKKINFFCMFKKSNVHRFT